MKNFVTTIENAVDGRNETYIKVRKADLIEACKVLGERELKVWLVLVSNADGYTTDHARKMVADNLEWDSGNVSKAFAGLAAKGYIEQKDNIETVRTYAGEKPANYVAPQKKGRNNHKVVARKACDEVVKSTDLSCQIDSTVLSNRQHDVVKLTVSSCQIDSTNITRLQDNNIYNSIDSNVSYISDDEFNKNNITGNDYYFGKGEIESDSELPF